MSVIAQLALSDYTRYAHAYSFTLHAFCVEESLDESATPSGLWRLNPKPGEKFFSISARDEEEDEDVVISIDRDLAGAMILATAKAKLTNPGRVAHLKMC